MIYRFIVVFLFLAVSARGADVYWDAVQYLNQVNAKLEQDDYAWLKMYPTLSPKEYNSWYELGVSLAENRKLHRQLTLRILSKLRNSVTKDLNGIPNSQVNNTVVTKQLQDELTRIMEERRVPATMPDSKLKHLQNENARLTAKLAKATLLKREGLFALSGGGLIEKDDVLRDVLSMILTTNSAPFPSPRLAIYQAIFWAKQYPQVQFARIAATRSMYPLMDWDTFAIITNKPYEDLAVGDIIAFNRLGEQVMHRITTINGDEITTQGDNSTHADREVVRKTNYIGYVARLLYFNAEGTQPETYAYGLKKVPPDSAPNRQVCYVRLGGTVPWEHSY